MANGTRRGMSLTGVETDTGHIIPVPGSAEGHMEVAVHAPRLPFGSVHTENLSPIFQIDSVYGINVEECVTTTGNSANPAGATTGTVTGSSNLFTCSTGTTAYSFSSLQSRRRLRYRPGQGVVGRFTALWSAPAANSIVVCGLGTGEAGYYFGYNGTSFGILYSNGGVREIQTLTVTTASTSTNSYQVTLAGTSYTVTATNNASTVKTAYEISKGTYAGWKAEQHGSTVVFLADSVGNKTGTFSLAQSGAGVPAAGSFVETTAGVASTDTWIPKADWNADPMDGTGPSGVILDPTKGNVFQINVQYLGFGAVVFMVEVSSEGNNPDFVTVHTIDYPNQFATVNLTQPAFPFTMAAYSAGSTTNVSVSCASAAGFIEGVINRTGPRTCVQRTTNNYVGSVASTYYPLFTLRNSLTHQHGAVTARANQSVVYPISISCSHDDATPVSFFWIRNATLLGTPSFAAFSADSCIDVDTAATTATCNADDIIFTYTLGQNSGGAYSFADTLSIQPGETYTLAATAVTGTATYVIGSINCREDQ